MQGETAGATINQVERTTAVSPQTRGEWMGQASWLAAGAILGFVVPAVLAGVFRLPRGWLVLAYLAVIGPFLYAYVRRYQVDVVEEVRRRWAWGVAAAVLVAALAVNDILRQPASAAPSGLELAFALLWLGVVYGTLDALLLSVFPVYATLRACASLGWTHAWTGRIGSGLLAIVVSALITVTYHAGYPEYRGPAMVGPVWGNTVQSLAYVASTNPLSAVLSHVTMHSVGVLQGMETIRQLPPHYP